MAKDKFNQKKNNNNNKSNTKQATTIIMEPDQDLHKPARSPHRT